MDGAGLAVSQTLASTARDTGDPVISRGAYGFAYERHGDRLAFMDAAPAPAWRADAPRPVILYAHGGVAKRGRVARLDPPAAPTELRRGRRRKQTAIIKARP